MLFSFSLHISRYAYETKYRVIGSNYRGITDIDWSSRIESLVDWNTLLRAPRHIIGAVDFILRVYYFIPCVYYFIKYVYSRKYNLLNLGWALGPLTGLTHAELAYLRWSLKPITTFIAIQLRIYYCIFGILLHYFCMLGVFPLSST